MQKQNTESTISEIRKPADAGKLKEDDRCRWRQLNELHNILNRLLRHGVYEWIKLKTNSNFFAWTEPRECTHSDVLELDALSASGWKQLKGVASSAYFEKYMAVIWPTMIEIGI